MVRKRASSTRRTMLFLAYFAIAIAVALILPVPCSGPPLWVFTYLSWLPLAVSFIKWAISNVAPRSEPEPPTLIVDTSIECTHCQDFNGLKIQLSEVCEEIKRIGTRSDELDDLTNKLEEIRESQLEQQKILEQLKESNATPQSSKAAKGQSQGQSSSRIPGGFSAKLQSLREKKNQLKSSTKHSDNIPRTGDAQSRLQRWTPAMTQHSKLPSLPQELINMILDELVLEDIEEPVPCSGWTNLAKTCKAIYDLANQAYF